MSRRTGSPHRARGVAAALIGFVYCAVFAGSALAQCPNADLRKGVAAHLPDCRAYEQVSPVEKNGADAGVDVGGNIGESIGDRGGPTSADGSAAVFVSAGAFAGIEWGGSGRLSYLARRDGGGWRTTSLSPRPLSTDARANGGRVVGLDPAMEFSLLDASDPLTADPASSKNFYLQDNLTGALDLLVATASGASAGIAMSGDLSHFAFDTDSVLTTEPDQPAGNQFRIYEYADGQLRLVSRQPGSNSPFQVESILGRLRSTVGAVSDDGAHIYFTAPAFGGEEKVIYRRSNGASTAVASPSMRSLPDPNGTRAKIFEVATTDGNRVFFRSVEQLTNDANSSDASEAFNGDLYRYDFATDELIDLSAGTAGSAPAEVQGVVEISDDGDRVYFVAAGQVVPGEGDPDLSKPKLYFWEDDGTTQGTVRFIATLDDVGFVGLGGVPDMHNWAWDSNKVAQATPDGSHLVFQSRANITGFDPAGTSQVYIFSADAGAEADELACLSCPSAGGPPSGSSFTPSFYALTVGGGTPTGQEYPRSISVDGSRVVFSSPDALVGADTNGEYDAYLWDDGELVLLSSGKSSDDSNAFGMSASGDDAFFRTRESLVSQDGDTLSDIYTAHAGGGFLSQQPEAPLTCSDDDCQRGGQSPLSSPVHDAPTASHLGSGNVEQARSCRRFSRAAKRLAARRRRLLRRAAKVADRREAARLRRRSRRLRKQASRQRAKAKRCRRAHARGPGA
jgi:hypothetical protein